jgi:hypothetical protein
MAIKFTNIFHCKTLQNFPKLGFLFSKYASGNPAELAPADQFNTMGTDLISTLQIKKYI